MNKLFAGIRFVISGEVQEEVKLMLLNNGAEKHLLLSDFVTCCIVGDYPSEEDIDDAIQLYEIPAVTQEWVTRSLQCNKLLPTSAFQCGNRLFTGVIASFSRLSREDHKKMWAMLKYYGGTYSSSFNKTTTHLIVTAPEGSKYEQALKAPGAVRVVTPDWVVDSIHAGCLQPEDIYHPRLLLSSPTTGYEYKSQKNADQKHVRPCTSIMVPEAIDVPKSRQSLESLLEDYSQHPEFGPHENDGQNQLCTPLKVSEPIDIPKRKRKLRFLASEYQKEDLLASDPPLHTEIPCNPSSSSGLSSFKGWDLSPSSPWSGWDLSPFKKGQKVFKVVYSNENLEE